MKKRFVWNLLALGIVICALTVIFVSCSDDSPVENSDSVQDSDSRVADEGLIIFDGKGYKAKLVYPATGNSVASARMKINQALKAKFGVQPESVKDSDVVADADVIEILLGDTDRPESNVGNDYAENDAWYFVGIVGHKLVINASSEAMLERAVFDFANKYIVASEDTWSLNAEATISVHYEDFTAEDWLLGGLPYYAGSKVRYADNLYPTGGLITDRKAQSDMQIVTKTNASEFSAYIERLEKVGYTVKERRSEGSEIDFVTLESDYDNVYIYRKSSTVKIISDSVSTTVEEASYTAEGGSAEFYQYGLAMSDKFASPHVPDPYINNGMCLVIKCSDNSVIIVDGGYNTQMEGAFGQEFDEFLHEITNTPYEQKVRISAWYLTHAHGDHLYGFDTFIRKYHENYTVERIIANIASPEAVTMGSVISQKLTDLGKFLMEKYPDCKEVKLHNGQRLQIADVTVEALYTHEDNLSTVSATTAIGDFNDTSLVTKIYTEDMSMLVLGDMKANGCSAMRGFYSGTAFDSVFKNIDIIQVSHHGFDDLSSLYRAVDANYAFVPVSKKYTETAIAAGGSQATTKTNVTAALTDTCTGGIFYGGSSTNPKSLTVGLTFDKKVVKIS